MPTNIKNDRPLYEPLGALFDMGASAARGVSRGAVGLPGDLESLARLGLNKVGVPVSLESTLYNSNDLDKMWPKVTPLVADMSPMDELSAYLAPNIYGKAISSGYKGIKTLGGNVVGRDTSTSRRAFLKGTTAIGAGGLLAAKLKFVDDVLKQLPKTEDAAKVASKHKFNSLKEYNDYLNNTVKDNKELKALLARDDETYYSLAKESKASGWKDTSGNKLDANDPFRLELEEKLNEFSPKAKDEMRQFKKIADEYNYDKANTRMYEENPHMYNYPDIDEEVLLEKYLDKTHWSDYLDNYLDSKYE